jgi:hypothetical protein
MNKQDIVKRILELSDLPAAEKKRFEQIVLKVLANNPHLKFETVDDFMFIIVWAEVLFAIKTINLHRRHYDNSKKKDTESEFAIYNDTLRIVLITFDDVWIKGYKHLSLESETYDYKFHNLLCELTNVMNKLKNMMNNQ